MVGTKSEAFAIIEFHPELGDHEAELREICLKTRGPPRFEQLRKVDDNFGADNLPQERLDEWSNTFTSNYIDIRPPLFEDSVSTIEELKTKGYTVYLSSSVPQTDLEDTLERYDGVSKDDFAFLGTREEVPENYFSDTLRMKILSVKDQGISTM